MNFITVGWVLVKWVIFLVGNNDYVCLGDFYVYMTNLINLDFRYRYKRDIEKKYCQNDWFCSQLCIELSHVYFLTGHHNFPVTCMRKKKKFLRFPTYDLLKIISHHIYIFLLYH